MANDKKVPVRMQVSIAGHAEPTYNLDEDFSFQPNQVVELHPTLAEAWIDCGHAIAADPADVPPAPRKRKQPQSQK